MRESKSRFRPAGSRVEAGEIETTRAEKVLAVVLTVFIAIGAIWAYGKLDEVAKPSSASYASDRELLDPAELSAIQNHAQAVHAVATARSNREATTRQLELRREAYRTALEAGEPAAELKGEYETAQAKLATASKELTAAAGVAARTRPAESAAQSHLTELRQSAAEHADDERAEHGRIVFLLRLALLVLMLGGSYWLLGHLRSRHSRYLPVALAWIGATAVLAAVMAVDYTGDYIAFKEAGPLAISIVGIVLTLGAFVALQRFLAKRLPARRVRRHECPFCGFPVSDKPHCEGCGRAAIASCASCHKDRRVGAPRCAYCGNP